jgi:hypothetical protein
MEVCKPAEPATTASASIAQPVPDAAVIAAVDRQLEPASDGIFLADQPLTKAAWFYESGPTAAFLGHLD